MQYKVVYLFNHELLSREFEHIDCAFEYARRTNGIVLNAGGAR